MVPHDFEDPSITGYVKRADTAGLIVCRMDNDAILKSLHGALRGHGNFVRIHGNRGLMENCRHGDKTRLRIWREPWEKRRGEPVETVYAPDFPEHHNQALRAGHGGGDFFTNYHFAEAIRTGTPPYLDVYRALDMTLAGIQAWRSVLSDGAPVEIPDLRDESVRRKYANDHWSPDPTRPQKDHPPCSVLGEITPSAEALEFSKKIWARQGYFED